MLLAFLLLAAVLLLGVGSAYQAHIRRHPPHDLRRVTTEGLPSEASIRSGELGVGPASHIFRHWS